MMTSYILGADSIDGHEKSTINEVQKILKENGHTVINVGVGATVVQNKSLNTNADVAVQIVGGLDGEVFADYAHGIGKYYKVKKFISPLCSWIYKNKPASDFHHKNNVPNWKMVQAHDAKGKLRKMYVGKTIAEFMKEHPNVYVFGADTPREIAEKIMGHESGTKKKEKTPTTYLEMIKDLIKVWDGEMECYVRGDRVHIHRIPLPDGNKTKYKSNYDSKGNYHFIPREEVYYASESVNIVNKGISVTDYNPATTNKLVVKYHDEDTGKDSTIEILDKFLINRFGEFEKKMDAEEIRVSLSQSDSLRKTKTEKKKKKKKTKSKRKSKRKSTKKTKKKKKEKKKEKKVKSTKNIKQDKSKFKKVAITNKKDALNFARREWLKFMRENGHGVDVEVVGCNAFKVGTWCYLYAPTYSENIPMYIAGVDHQLSPNQEWTTKLKLVDFPPSISSLSEKDLENPEENNNTDASNGSTDSSSSSNSSSGSSKGRSGGKSYNSSGRNKSKSKSPASKKKRVYTQKFATHSTDTKNCRKKYRGRRDNRKRPWWKFWWW